jgi:hypothetical protein
VGEMAGALEGIVAASRALPHFKSPAQKKPPNKPCLLVRIQVGSIYFLDMELGEPQKWLAERTVSK